MPVFHSHTSIPKHINKKTLLVPTLKTKDYSMYFVGLLGFIFYTIINSVLYYLKHEPGLGGCVQNEFFTCCMDLIVHLLLVVFSQQLGFTAMRAGNGDTRFH